MMNEQARQSYLNALGLENYVPRWVLPNAPRPVACEWPELAQAEPSTAVQPAEAETGADSATDGPSPLAEVMRDMGERPPEPSMTSPSVAPEPDASPKVEPFTLSIWRSSLPLLVLDARQPRTGLPTGRLLHNLLLALGPVEPDSISEEILPWPLVETPSMQLTAADARTELHTWLEAELAARPVRALVLMGDKAGRYFLSEDADLAALLWRTIDLHPFERPALVAPSLIELLHEPLKKRDLWQALQSLLPL